MSELPDEFWLSETTSRLAGSYVLKVRRVTAEAAEVRLGPDWVPIALGQTHVFAPVGTLRLAEIDLRAQEPKADGGGSRVRLTVEREAE
ncbi:MAG: hypothetical protein LBJ44_08815 [Propionibacteriaceae bacterium]|jgi:hypothetical protein|nr:hypothetical protein [Propionibacteriaceae bacterium]